jgi:hypothetical protein
MCIKTAYSVAFDFYVCYGGYLLRTTGILQNYMVTHCLIFSYTSFTTYELVTHEMFSIPCSGSIKCLFTVQDLMCFFYTL